MPQKDVPCLFLVVELSLYTLTARGCACGLEFVDKNISDIVNSSSRTRTLFATDILAQILNVLTIVSYNSHRILRGEEMSLESGGDPERELVEKIAR